MKTLTITWVVNDEDEADSLLNEITEDICNGYGSPYIYAKLDESSIEEIESYKELNQ